MSGGGGPAAEHFVFRPARLDDAPAVLDVVNAAAIELQGSAAFLLEDVQRWWTVPRFDLESSTRLALTPDGRVVAYASLWDIDEVPVSAATWTRVHPEFTDRGLGTQLLAWAEGLAVRVFERLPPDVRVVFGAVRANEHEPTGRLLVDHGLSPARHFWRMAVDLAEPPDAPRWPDGIRLVPFEERGDLEEYARAADEAFADHWGHTVTPLEDRLAWLRHEIEHGSTDTALWFLAMDGDDVAGVARNCARAERDPDMAYVDTIAVRRPWRRRGIALALLAQSLAALRDAGHRAACLDVDAANLTGATRLYEKAGMHVHRRTDWWEKELRAGRDVRIGTE